MTVTVDPERERIVLTPAAPPGVRPGFVDRVDRFIERYQPTTPLMVEGGEIADRFIEVLGDRMAYLSL